jgi:hypothetical protein
LHLRNVQKITLLEGEYFTLQGRVESKVRSKRLGGWQRMRRKVWRMRAHTELASQKTPTKYIDQKSKDGLESLVPWLQQLVKELWKYRTGWRSTLN